MKTLDDLEKYYESELLPSLQAVEKDRRRIITALAVMTAVLFAAVAAPSAVLYLANQRLLAVAVILSAIAGAAWMLGYHFLTHRYVREFKASVLTKIIAFIDDQLAYNPSQHVSQEYFTMSGIFLKYPDRFTGEDYVSGMAGKTKIEFSEIHADYKVETTDSKGRRTVSFYPIFDGIFFIADFNKNFKGTTIVLPDTAQRLLGNLMGSALQSMNTERGQLIKLEDPSFEKQFVVYGSDQIESRYILTPGLMQRITEFREKTNRHVYLSFTEQKVMVAIPSKEDIFEPKLFYSIIEFKQVESYFKQLELVIGIVDDLNLNVRIWGRE
jgi:hypothetical protein